MSAHLRKQITVAQWDIPTHPNRDSFEFNTDPKLKQKVRDVNGHCLYPPEQAVVVCAWMRSGDAQHSNRQQCCCTAAPAWPHQALHPSTGHQHKRAVSAALGMAHPGRWPARHLLSPPPPPGVAGDSWPRSALLIPSTGLHVVL